MRTSGTSGRLLRRLKLCGGKLWSRCRIGKVLSGMDDVREFDEGLFGMLIERIKVVNLIQVEFVLSSGVRVVEIL